MSIGSRILEARSARNLTQEELASRIGITKGAIANYENGVSTPRIEIMFKLLDALECDANFLYQDDMRPVSRDSSLSSDETILLNGYRSLSTQGKEYMQQTLVMAMNTYKKTDCVSFVESEEA